VTVHELKTWPEPFEEMWAGRKRYEIRRMDRPFAVRDRLRLREWDPETGYSGRELEVLVTYMTPPGHWGLPEGLCVMSVATTLRLWGDERKIEPDGKEGT
jgi:hypothetical protein